MIRIEPKVTVSVQVPPGTIERLERKVETLFWAGFCGGLGLGLALAVAFWLWRKEG